MTVLNATERGQVTGATQRWWSGLRELTAFTKPDLVAAINATDAWIDANATAYNNALPLPFRTSATSVQKSLLLVYVALRRVKRDGSTIPMPGE